MTALAQYLAILRKDLLLEWRARDLLYSMTLFSVLLVVVFAFAFVTERSAVIDYGPGILWVTIIFGATVGLNRLFDRERVQGCLDGMMSAPVLPAIVFTAKASAHYLFTLAMGVPTIGLIVLFFDLQIIDWVSFLGALALGAMALSLVGSLFSAMLANNHLKEVLLPLVVYPVMVPVIIAGVKVVGGSLGAPGVTEYGSWLRFMIGFDMIFGAVTTALFGPMMRGNGGG